MKETKKLFIKVKDESKLMDRRKFGDDEYATIDVNGTLYDCVKQGDKWLAYSKVIIEEVEI